MQRRAGTGPRVPPVKTVTAPRLLLATAVICISGSICSACGDWNMKQAWKNAPMAAVLCLGRSDVSQASFLPYWACSQATLPGQETQERGHSNSTAMVMPKDFQLFHVFVAL